MSSLLLAGIAWDRLLLLFCPQRRTNISAWVFAAGALALSIFAASPYGYSHRLKNRSIFVSIRHFRVFANCQLNFMVCSIAYVNSETGLIDNESEEAVQMGLKAVILNFFTSYLITLLHLLVFAVLIIGKVFLVARRTRQESVFLKKLKLSYKLKVFLSKIFYMK